jgi:hypothetical protein
MRHRDGQDPAAGADVVAAGARRLPPGRRLRQRTIRPGITRPWRHAAERDATRVDQLDLEARGLGELPEHLVTGGHVLHLVE